MATTVQGGRYRTASGQLINAHGQPIKEDEPQAEPTGNKAGDAGNSANELIAIKGIAEARARQLTELGIGTFRELAEAATADLAKALGVPEAQVGGWQAQAAQLSA